MATKPQINLYKKGQTKEKRVTLYSLSSHLFCLVASSSTFHACCIFPSFSFYSHFKSCPIFIVCNLLLCIIEIERNTETTKSVFYAVFFLFIVFPRVDTIDRNANDMKIRDVNSTVWCTKFVHTSFRYVCIYINAVIHVFLSFLSFFSVFLSWVSDFAEEVIDVSVKMDFIFPM